MSNIWFAMPSVEVPTGGINNCYRLCAVAEESGIKARVLSERVYPHCDPGHLSRFWVRTEPGTFDHPEVSEGDLVVQPDIFHFPLQFSKPVRRVVYAQNWSLMPAHAPWIKHVWTYSNWTHLTYCMESLAYSDYRPRDPLPSWRPADWTDTAGMVNKPKMRWSAVSPYFDLDLFSPGSNDPTRVLTLPRRLAGVSDRLLREMPENVVRVDNVTPAELRSLYREVGILVLPSAAEGLSFPICEALLSGCAVVSWPCGAPEDILIDRHSGLMARFGDVDGLVSLARGILGNRSEQQRLSSNGARIVRSVYNRDRSRTEVLLAYHAALTIGPE
jgi:hypothetical protein